MMNFQIKSWPENITNRMLEEFRLDDTKADIGREILEYETISNRGKTLAESC